MKSLLQLSLSTLAFVCSTAFAQEPEATPDAGASEDRQARIEQRRELSPEQRQERRQQARERFESLDEEQRQAVRERRQERQANRPEGQRGGNRLVSASARH